MLIHRCYPPRHQTHGIRWLGASHALSSRSETFHFINQNEDQRLRVVYQLLGRIVDDLIKIKK